jgi:hypothetical protein
MSKPASERAREYRERLRRAPPEASEESTLVLLLRETIADLQARLDASEKRHERRDERDERRDGSFVTTANAVTNAVEKLAIIASGFGGKGGSGSGSPSLSGSSEKAREATEFQDLNGKTRAHGYLQNGTRVPGSLGDAVVTNGSVTDRHDSVTRDERAELVFDSQRAETEEWEWEP